MDIPSSDLIRVRDLYNQGLYRQALESVASFQPIRDWSNTPARLIGGRLAIQLGAPKLGRGLHLLAFRATPTYPEAIYYHARYRFERFGPFAVWRFMREHLDWSDASPELQADWLALQGFVAARLRDFDRAERYLNRAEATAPDRPWTCIERASTYEFADRLDDSLAASKRSMELQPWFRPGVQSFSHVLLRLGRDKEALDFLVEANSHLESGLVIAQLATLQNDLGHHHDAAKSLDRYADLSPMMEPEVRKWLDARRADTCYFLGDAQNSQVHARAVGEEFFTEFANRLATTPTIDRLVLPVDLSYERTPPTVPELLTRFWNQPYPPAPEDHEPAPDGLPDASERQRLEAAGWVAREFLLTVEAAHSLAERGVPIAVSLVEGGFSQARLVIGADRRRQTVFFADGAERHPAEAPHESLRKRYHAFGPRALAMVPSTEASRLANLELPEAAEYDRLYAVEKPLLDNRREAALLAYATMKTVSPEHRLTKFAAIALARHDAHPVKLLDALDDLLTLFPHEPSLVLSRTSVLRELNRMEERQAALEVESWKTDADPTLMQSLAQMLLPLPNRQRDASRLLRRSLRLRPMSAAAFYLLGTQHWEKRELTDAVELYRFACGLDENEDQFADAYARAAKHVDQVPEALRLFQQRAGRAEVPSPAATRALYYALLDREEPEQAAAALNQAIHKLSEIKKKPRDGTDPAAAHAELLIFRAECAAAKGQWDDSERDLNTAQDLASPAAWNRAAARLARLKPDFAAAALHLLEVIRIEPLSIESHRSLVALLLDTEGRTAARAHLGQACQQHPHHYPLLKLRAEFLSTDADADPDRAVQDILDDCPRDAWAHRQRALILADRRRHAEALDEITRAGELEPDHPWYFSVLAQVHRRADRTDQAIAACKEGLRRNIDQEVLVQDLMQFSRGRKEKQDAMAFLTAELRRQPHTGEGLIAFYAAARDFYTDPDDHGRLLETLEDFLDMRPDLWQAWSLVVQQMMALNRLEEARAMAQDATEHFPLLAKLWVDLAEVCQALGYTEEQIDALRQAVAVAPGWSLPARELAEALEESDESDEAIAVLEKTVDRAPMDPLAHGFLAERLWEAGRSREALNRAKMAVRQEPGYDWAWHVVPLWAERMELPDEAIELARQLTKDRAGDPRVWLRLARLLQHPRYNDEALAALDRAISLDPRSVETNDLKAERLAEMGRYEEALAAAQPPKLIEGDGLPIVLQGRVAWIEAKRGNYASAIPPMQALVAVDPTYVWGWQQLAEWYNDTSHPEGYLEAASELVRLQPFHPVAFMMRGDAKVQTGDREGGKADLREALKITPGFSHAAALLFDAHLADLEIREARQALAMLQEHAAGQEVAVKQIQLAVKINDPDAAMRSFVEVCEGTGQSPFPLQMAMNEMRDAGWEERSVRALREAWQGGGPFHPWVPLFWIASDEGQATEPGEKLSAVDAGLKAYPKFLPLHDSRAEHLGISGRYDEALAACKPADLGEPPPIELRGRAAWVEARRGDKAKAVTMMKVLVAEDPSFVFGWRQMAAWYDALERYRECLDAADQFARLEPENPLAYVYRGEARRSVSDRRGALADFQKAFDMDPQFDSAGMNLVTEQLAADDVSGAAKTLAKLFEHSDGPLLRLRAVEVSCRQGEKDPAIMHFRGLATDDEVTRSLLREAAAAFDAAGWGERITAELRDICDILGMKGDVAGVWAERAIEREPTDVISERLPRMMASNPRAGREVLLTYAWAKAARGQPVHGLIQRYSENLRTKNDTWARSGGVLVAAKHYSLAAAWLADWRDRKNVKAWMLKPLVVALRAIDQDDKALDVCRAGVRLGEENENLVEFRVWLALDLALSGQTAEAAAQATNVDGVAVSDGNRLILAFAQALVMVQQAGPEGKASAFSDAKDHLKSAAGSVISAEIPIGAGRAYRRVVAKLVEDAGSFGARIWSLRQRLRPWVKG